MRKLILSLALALMLLVLSAVPAFALTSQDVTVTATPSFIGIANAPSAWDLNDASPVLVDTVYYANPEGTTTPPSATVLDAECDFTITNSSTIATDLTVNCGDFAGGPTMTNSDSDGSNGATTYGGFSWYSGMTYSGKVVMKTTGSAVLKDALVAETNIKWGAEIETRTTAWDSGDEMEATMTITATAD